MQMVVMGMASAGSRIHLGQIVRILRGRTAGVYAVVLKHKSGYVWVADGKVHPITHPKKKNIKHIQPTNYVVKKIAEVLAERGCPNNASVRFAINQYQSPHKQNLEGE
jgi:large subunit ribosomal protein L14e